MAFFVDVRNSEGDDVSDVSPEQEARIIAGSAKAVLDALGRQPNGDLGLIGIEVRHVFGGYPDGHTYTDAALLYALRKTAGLSKSS